MLWHGTSDTDPMVICTSRDGVDARRVRRLVGWSVHFSITASAVIWMLRYCLQSRSEYQECARVRRHGRTIPLYQRKALYYGRGAYFSDTAAYCDESYAFEEAGQSVSPPRRELILARVLCGRVREYGKAKAPELTFAPEGFDSVRGGPHKFNAGGVASCNMTVVFDRVQVYPQYIVTYTR